jgi:hypothetical protein
MKTIVMLILTTAFITKYLDAQIVEDSVKGVVKQLFDGMRNSDAAAIRAAFADSAILQTISKNSEGSIIVRNESVSDFAKSIAELRKGAADEQIVFESIKLDPPLAMVWAPYKFYFDGKFSHCGVDSFQLVWVNGRWKIQYLIDTRRKQPCGINK